MGNKEVFCFVWLYLRQVYILVSVYIFEEVFARSGSFFSITTLIWVYVMGYILVMQFEISNSFWEVRMMFPIPLTFKSYLYRITHSQEQMQRREWVQSRDLQSGSQGAPPFPHPRNWVCSPAKYLNEGYRIPNKVDVWDLKVDLLSVRPNCYPQKTSFLTMRWKADRPFDWFI